MLLARLQQFFALLLLVTALLAPCRQIAVALPAENTATATSYTDYKQIPGVTQDEIDAIERVKAARGSLEFGAVFSSNAFLTENNRVEGFYSLLSERLSSLFAMPFTPVIYDKTTLNARISSGATDFTCTPSFIRGESPRSLFSVETGIQHPVFIYKKRGAKTFSVGNGKKRALKMGFLKNAPFVEQVLQPMPEAVPVFFASHEEVIAWLESGDLDAFFDYDTASAIFEMYPEIVSREFLPLCLGPVTISTANPDLAAFISVMGKYIAHNGNQELRSLYSKGKAEYDKSRLFKKLNKEEIAYLKAHRNTPVPFAASYDNYPICFFDETKKKYQGMSIEVLDQIAKLTGLTFEPSNPYKAPWVDLLQMLENGKVAFASELIYTHERGAKFLWPDQAYTVDSYALISDVKREDISIGEIPNYRVGVISGTGYTEDFYRWFPNHPHRVAYTTYAEAFEALADGEVDFVMGTKHLLLNNVNYLEKTGFRANVIFNHEYESAYGFHPSQRILRDIFSKTQSLIDMDDISQRWKLRTYDYQKKLEQEQAKNTATIIQMVAALLFISAVLIVGLFIRRKQTADLLNKKLEETVRLRSAELEKQTNSAKEASRSKSDFLARMSHEIRTPLNAVIGLSYIAKQASTPGSKAHKATSDAIAASTHLLGILNDVLDMTKLEAGKLMLIVEPFPLKEAMDEVISIITEGSAGKRLTFEHNVDLPGPIIVDGDKMRLKQVLINLLGNAVKFTPPNGYIHLDVACSPASEPGKAHIQFTVSDNGIGISKDQIGKIYGAFEQANASIATNFGGAGLGLSISQRLVTIMGGTITVQSQVKVGSIFSFALTLPLVDATQNRKDEGPKSVNLTGKRILSAEDVEMNRLILLEYLAETNANVDVAEDGLIACIMFEQAPQGHYDLILMDIQMPNMDGYEATRRIRALDRPDAKSIPIIAVTANTYQDDISRAISSGMNGHLPKPIDCDQLIGTIAEFFPAAATPKKSGTTPASPAA